jgi:hypothetical protein
MHFLDDPVNGQLCQHRPQLLCLKVVFDADHWETSSNRLQLKFNNSNLPDERCQVRKNTMFVDGHKWKWDIPLNGLIDKKQLIEASNIWRQEGTGCKLDNRIPCSISCSSLDAQGSHDCQKEVWQKQQGMDEIFILDCFAKKTGPVMRLASIILDVAGVKQRMQVHGWAHMNMRKCSLQRCHGGCGWLHGGVAWKNKPNRQLDGSTSRTKSLTAPSQQQSTIMFHVQAGRKCAAWCTGEKWEMCGLHFWDRKVIRNTHSLIWGTKHGQDGWSHSFSVFRDGAASSFSGFHDKVRRRHG